MSCQKHPEVVGDCVRCLTEECRRLQSEVLVREEAAFREGWAECSDSIHCGGSQTQRLEEAFAAYRQIMKVWRP